MVFRPLGDSLPMKNLRFMDGVVPGGVVKVFAALILLGLDCLYTMCPIIHCDTIERTIVFRFYSNTDQSILQQHAGMEQNHLGKVNGSPGGHIIYKSHDNFGPMPGGIGGPVIMEFDRSMDGKVREACNHDIQIPGMVRPDIMS